MSGIRNAPPISICSPREIDDLLARGKRVQGEQHRGGVVVDDRRRLAAHQVLQQADDQIVPVAAAAGVEVVFEVAGMAHRERRRLHCLFGEQCTPEVRVQHGAGEVEDRAEPWLRLAREPVTEVRGEGRFAPIGRAAAVEELLTGFEKERPDRAHDRLTAVALEMGTDGREAENAIDGRQSRKSCGLRGTRDSTGIWHRSRPVPPLDLSRDEERVGPAALVSRFVER